MRTRRPLPDRPLFDPADEIRDEDPEPVTIDDEPTEPAEDDRLAEEP